MDIHLRHALDAELDASVGEEKLVAEFDRAWQVRVRHRHSAGGALDRIRREDERVTGFEHDAPVGDGADAHLGSREVLEHGDGGIQPFSESADSGEDHPVLGVFAVAEVLQRSGAFPAPPPLPEGFGGYRSVGIALYTDYVLLVEMASLLLTAAIVGALILAKRKID